MDLEYANIKMDLNTKENGITVSIMGLGYSKIKMEVIQRVNGPTENQKDLLLLQKKMVNIYMRDIYKIKLNMVKEKKYQFKVNI